MTNQSAEHFELQPVLTGERVVVRPLDASDWEGMFATASDPRIWEQHPATDRYTEPVFRDYFYGAMRSGSAFAFVNLNRSEIEIGWTFLSRAYWGGSYNREIKALMLDHAFRFVDTVVFWVGAENTRSRRAMEKIGGTLRDGIVTREASGDDPYVVYEIARSNYPGT